MKQELNYSHVQRQNRLQRVRARRSKAVVGYIDSRHILARLIPSAGTQEGALSESQLAYSECVRFGKRFEGRRPTHCCKLLSQPLIAFMFSPLFDSLYKPHIRGSVTSEQLLDSARAPAPGLTAAQYQWPVGN